MTTPAAQRPARWVGAGLALLAAGCGLLALALGQDASWDLRNYHYYNGYALPAGRFGHDLLVAQLPSFFNPALDVAYYALTEALSGRGVAFVLGCVQGLNAVPLFVIARALLAAELPQRDALALALAAAGLGGAIALSELGTTFHDNVISLGILGALALLAAGWDELAAGPRGLVRTLAAGGLLGLAFALKQTQVLFVLGAGLALLLTVPARPRRRLLLGLAGTTGVLAGAAAGGGWWLLRLWHAYGNPLFPFYNHVFRSPWALAQSYRDPGFLPGEPGLFEALGFPLRFTLEPRLAAEATFTDHRLLALYLLLPLAFGVFAWRRRPAVPVRVRPLVWLALALAIAYALWLALFRIYRYLLPLEMLAPTLLVAALGLLLGRGRAWALASTALLAVLLATTRPPDWLREPFAARAIEVRLPAPLPLGAGAVVLLAGHEPLSFLLPALPRDWRFLRIDSTFTHPGEDAVAFNPLMRRLVAAQRGPLGALFIETERHEMLKKLAAYGLALDAAGCRPLTANIGAGAYALCPVHRPDDPATETGR